MKQGITISGSSDYATEDIPVERGGYSGSQVPDTAAALELKPGEWVEVRSAAEIAATLDAQGRLDGLPFMPEMILFCGHRFRVLRRADSTCYRGLPRRIESTVHLEELRCDGSAHRNCRAACLLLWKEAWLRRPGSAEPPQNAPVAADTLQKNLAERVIRQDGGMMCQATELGKASCPMILADPVEYLLGIPRACIRREIGITELRHIYTFLRGKLILWLFRRWTRAPWNAGRYQKTPSRKLDLQLGDMVKVRGTLAILRTLDRNGCNKGMEFKPEMFQFCGRTYRVLGRMPRRIDEHSGQMRAFRNECIILEGVHCHGQRSFCARANYHYWREIWLRRA
jgi:hypothetical protein